MSDNPKKNTHKREMEVAFVSGHSRRFTLKGDLVEMEEKVVSYVWDALWDNEPFYAISDATLINPRNVTAVSFGPIEENYGAYPY